MANANPVNTNPDSTPDAPKVDDNGVPLETAKPEFPRTIKLDSHKATRTDW